jgi:hypothetical protein
MTFVRGVGAGWGGIPLLPSTDVGKDNDACGGDTDAHVCIYVGGVEGQAEVGVEGGLLSSSMGLYS